MGAPAPAARHACTRWPRANRAKSNARGVMYTLEQYRCASREAQLNIRYAHERLRDMSSVGEISGPLFRERQLYMSRCIEEWRLLCEGLLSQVHWRQQSPRITAAHAGGTSKTQWQYRDEHQAQPVNGDCPTNAVPACRFDETSDYVPVS